MPPEPHPPSTASQASLSQAAGGKIAGGEIAGGEITPELIRQVTDRVYAMLLADLRLEFERSRRLIPPRKGGR